jgi:Domain of unknown function (DUF4252)
MRKYLLIAIITLGAALPAAAQQRLNLDFLAGLEDRAEEVVDITLDQQMLRLATKFLNGKNDDERAVREIVGGLKGIYVRSYEFARTGEYDRSLIDRIKSQLGPSWKPLVTVRSKTKENVNIMADMAGDNIVGLVVIAAEPRELTVVNIVGSIDLDKLAQLEGEFGIPHISTRERDRD